MNPETPSNTAAPREASGAGAMAARDDGRVHVFGVRGRKQRVPETSIEPLDFRHCSVLTPGELRRIRIRQEQFVRALAARFSIHLRMEFGMTIARLQTLSYQRLIDGLRSPTHLALFKTEPLKGVCLLEVPPRLALLIIDRLLGGPGQAPSDPAELTDIEVSLLDQAHQIVLAEWCANWKDLQELRAVPLGHENNARFLQTAPADAPMLSLAIEVTVGTFSEQLQVLAPIATLEPLLRKLTSAAIPEKDPASASSGRPLWNCHYDDVLVPMSAEWRGLQMTARQIAALKVGDVLLMAPDSSSQVHLSLAERTNSPAGLAPVAALGGAGSRAS